MKTLSGAVVMFVLSTGYAIADDDVQVCIAADSNRYEHIASNVCDLVAGYWVAYDDCTSIVMPSGDILAAMASDDQSCEVAVLPHMLAPRAETGVVVTHAIPQQNYGMLRLEYSSTQYDDQALSANRIGVLSDDTESDEVLKHLAGEHVDTVVLAQADPFAQAKEYGVRYIFSTRISLIESALPEMAAMHGITLHDANQEYLFSAGWLPGLLVTEVPQSTTGIVIEPVQLGANLVSVVARESVDLDFLEELRSKPSGSLALMDPISELSAESQEQIESFLQQVSLAGKYAQLKLQQGKYEELIRSLAELSVDVTETTVGQVVDETVMITKELTDALSELFHEWGSQLSPIPKSEE